ncbi:MAG: hypothetical protein IJ058_07960 [Lachnospiraceae bacterium]|nr:hypothetical protein [Lachnospiraceae bacterium]
MKEQNPFTHTYGMAGQAYIDMGWSRKAIENFSYEHPTEYVYKIVGVRGSGKTVVMSDIMKHFRSENCTESGWLVYDLSSARDPLHTLVSYLSKEKFALSCKRISNIKAGANLGVINAEFSSNSPDPDRYYDDEVELDGFLDQAFAKGKRILVCIDDIARTDEVVAFCSVYAKYIRAEKPIYFVCTGLFKNLDAIGRVKNLTFFRRAASINVGALSDVSITNKYRKLLNLDMPEARRLAKMTKGYAYAYQVLGSLYFDKTEKDSEETLLIDFDDQLFSQSYEKIWEELTTGEKEVVKIMIDHKVRQEIEQRMENPSSLSEYRNSLLKGGIIKETGRGEIDFNLPRFEDYVRNFCLD